MIVLFNTKSVFTPTQAASIYPTPHETAEGLFVTPLRMAGNSLAVQAQLGHLTSLSHSVFHGQGGNYS